MLTSYANYLNQLDNYLGNFKLKQQNEKEKLMETINFIKDILTARKDTKTQLNHRSNSQKLSSPDTTQYNGITIDANNTLSRNHKHKRYSTVETLDVLSHKRNSIADSSFLAPSSSTPSTMPTENSVYQLHQLQTSKSYGTTKNGFLLKHSTRSRMRKNWLKRKCVVQNGLFYIHHGDLQKEPVCLNLITCQVKIVDTKRFKLFSGSSKKMKN